MTEETVAPATTEDLQWWLQFAPTVEWTWATTYADSAPHWYVILGRTEGMSKADFVRAGRVIRTFGEPGKFWAQTNLYLFTEDRQRKFWGVWSLPPKANEPWCINLATTERTYGPQSDFDPKVLSMLVLPTAEEQSGEGESTLF